MGPAFEGRAHRLQHKASNFRHNSSVRAPVLPIVAACLVGGALAAGTRAASPGRPDSSAVKRITWDDVAPLRPRLDEHAIRAGSFAAFVERTHAENLRRVREGDLDHLVFYILQSDRFTKAPAIEPALSAKALVEGLPDPQRDAFLKGEASPPIAPPVRARIREFVDTLETPPGDRRLAYFQNLVRTSSPQRELRESALAGEYLRVMRFVYQKEFIAQRTGPKAVAELYRTRGLSTDTAVEAGFVVYQGLGIVRSLEPARRIRRVLIVGPGLDLAPRTGLLEASPPESYQPWAVIDALLSLGLSRADDLQVVGGDINPRVIERLHQSRAEPPVLTLVSEIRQSDTVSLSVEYRDYFERLGSAIGEADPSKRDTAQVAPGHLVKTVRVAGKVASVLRAAPLDIVTERLDDPGFDLIVATNILPYFDDVQLMLAMSNVAAMLAPGGVFLHNEAREVLGDITTAVGLPFEQSRHVVIASVRGAAAPLYDSVWLHRKR
jgi:hypothetical protein